MVIDNNKRTIKLLSGVLVLLILLAVCINFDFADNNTVSNNATKVKLVNYTKYNGTYYVDSYNDSVIVPKKTDKLYTVKSNAKNVKKKLPTISMWAKPSVRCGYPYKWYYRTFINYCPNCHHYNCLLKNPKIVPENEYTCGVCDSDFDGVVGKEKYSWSNVYLIKA